jgi:hypothetical protein
MKVQKKLATWHQDTKVTAVLSKENAHYIEQQQDLRS